MGKGESILMETTNKKRATNITNYVEDLRYL